MGDSEIIWSWGKARGRIYHVRLEGPWKGQAPLAGKYGARGLSDRFFDARSYARGTTIMQNMTPDEMLALADEAEALDEKATPGPWEWLLYPGVRDTREPILQAPHDNVCDFGDSETYYPSNGNAPNTDDMMFIAESRSLVPRLAAALREAVRQLGQSTEAWLREHHGQDPIYEEKNRIIANQRELIGRLQAELRYREECETGHLVSGLVDQDIKIKAAEARAEVAEMVATSGAARIQELEGYSQTIACLLDENNERIAVLEARLKKQVEVWKEVVIELSDAHERIAELEARAIEWQRRAEVAEDCDAAKFAYQQELFNRIADAETRHEEVLAEAVKMGAEIGGKDERIAVLEAEVARLNQELNRIALGITDARMEDDTK